MAEGFIPAGDQGVLGNVGQQWKKLALMPLLCQGGCSKSEFAGRVGIVYTLSSVGNSVGRKAAPESVRCFSDLDQHFCHICTLNLPLNSLSKAFYQHWEIPKGLGNTFQWCYYPERF